MMNKKMQMCMLALLLIFSFTGCKTAQDDNENTEISKITDNSVELNESSVDANSSDEAASEVDSSEEDTTDENTTDENTTNENTTNENTTAENTTNDNTSNDDTTINILSFDGSALDTTEMFTDRDLQQSADLTDAVSIELENNQDVTIDQEGVYVISGKANEATIRVEADAEAKVQIVFDGVSISNESSPAIYVKSADKVFVTSTESENYLEVSGTFVADGDTNTDAVIFSKADLTLNGLGTIEIVSSVGNGITSKDDLKVTGGVYNITSSADGMEANDSILIYDGTFRIASNKDALHSENEDYPVANGQRGKG